MNRSEPLTDELIQAAFERRARRADFDGLRENILAQTAATPQRRFWRIRTAPFFATELLRPAWIALLVAIALVGAALAVAIVGQHRRPQLHAGSWVRAGNMLQAREQFGATLLGNGKVLVAGGFTGTQTSASSELFDPNTEVWTATGGMTEPRQRFTATRLADGTVLVAGGVRYSKSDQPVLLDSAELYDPGSGSWTSVGHMHEARPGSTATLLPDGMVLVVGGSGQVVEGATSRPLASAELYDPVSRSWTATGSMIRAREGFTATLLQDGKVLVAGGSPSGLEATASAELYDPSSGSWTATGAMTEARVAAAATLLRKGTVLVAGGHTGSGLHDNALASAELYDPGTGSWTATGSMLTPDAYLTATLLPDGGVLVAGGFENDTGRPSVELFDPVAGSWGPAGNRVAPSTEPSATLLPDGKVLIAGGSVTGTPLNTTELYDPAGGI